MRSSKKYCQLQTQRLQNTKTTKSVVRISKNKLNQSIQIYKWRCSTQFPIPKLVSWKVTHPKINSPQSQQWVQIQVQYVEIKQRLSDYEDIPLFKLFYLFKQALIGFERLCNQYYYFNVTHRNIMIDSDRKCKVWLTEKIQQNFAKKIQSGQTDFVRKLINIFNKHCLKSKQANQFFGNLKANNTFAKALKYLQYFTKLNKIIIPSHFIQIKKLNCNKVQFTKFNQYHNQIESLKMSKQTTIDNELQETYQLINQSQSLRDSSKKEMKKSGNTAETQNLNNDFLKLSSKSIEQQDFQFVKNQKLQYLYRYSENLKSIGLQKPLVNKIWKSHYDKIKPKKNIIRRLSNTQKLSLQFILQSQNASLQQVNTHQLKKQSNLKQLNQLTKSITFQQNPEIKASVISRCDSEEQIMNLKRLQNLSINGWILTKFQGLLQNCRVMEASFLQNSNTPRKKQVKFDYLDKYRNSLFQSAILQQQSNLNN